VGWPLKKNQVDEESSEYDEIYFFRTFLHYEEPLGHIFSPQNKFFGVCSEKWWYICEPAIKIPASD
jgi:hypothetical protein